VIGTTALEPFLAALLAGALVAAAPLLLAALGEAVGQRAGLLNLGIEGTMLCGAFFGFVVALATGSALAGMAAGLAVGLLLGALFGLLAIGLGLDQILLGLAITIAGGGLTAFLYRDIFGRQNPAAAVRPLVLPLGPIEGLPVVGLALADRPLLLWGAYALTPVFAFVLARSRFGLHLRAVGEAPAAADAAGVDVARVRLAAALTGGAMTGLAGAFLSVVDLKLFQPGMTVGTGFIALALAMVGAWRPGRILLAAVSFGLLRALANGIQILGIDVRPEFVTMLPYVGTMAALVLLARSTRLPAALGVPYTRGQR
jgi:simple sugar transport system permease protein